MCLINTHILIYRQARYDCNLWKALWFHCVFWVFLYIIDKHTCLKYCIFTKLSQIVYHINMHIWICQHTRSACKLWNASWLYYVFSKFCTQSTNIHVKLSQIVSLINTYILVCWNIKCNDKLQKVESLIVIFEK